MVDVAVFKLKKVPGVSTDEWDEDGDLELSHKVEVQEVKQKVLIQASEITPDVLLLDSEPFAIIPNYKNQGYCRIRFDEATKKNLIANLKYVEKAQDRTYIWRTFKDMIRSNELTIDDWFNLIMEHLKFETEEQTFSVILDEVLYTWKHGLLSDT